jgi:hypothetical protein
MATDWVVGAQLSTSHAAVERSTIEEAFAGIARILSSVPLDILIVGAREAPELFNALTDRHRRPVRDVFLWHNLLSDAPGLEVDDLVVNWRGEKSRGWGGWAEQNPDVQESFRFACPNNPEVRRKTLEALGQLLERYPFDGIFLDKTRYPSPANGADEMWSCFCPHCRRAAAEAGLDLTAVARLIQGRDFSQEIRHARLGGVRGLWTEELLAEESLIRRFLRFRSDSITRLVAQVGRETRARSRKMALDLFSPSLAPVVGQDYQALAPHADWVKPMTYRVARGPASLRLEVPALIDNLADLAGAAPADIARWCADHGFGFGPDTLETTRRIAAPFDIVRDEITMAVRRMSPVPVYFGLELISYPGSIEIAPADVLGAVAAGRAAKAAGAIISWDLMYAPADGVGALGEELRCWDRLRPFPSSSSRNDFQA